MTYLKHWEIKTSEGVQLKVHHELEFRGSRLCKPKKVLHASTVGKAVYCTV